MKSLLLKIKQYTVSTIAIILIVAVFIGIIFFILYLKNVGKKLQIKPEFKIIDCKKEDIETLSESVSIAKDILSRIQK